MRRRSILTIRAVALLAIACACVTPARADPFYDATAAEMRGRPGSVIRAEPMHGAPPGSTAYRVLYRSTGVRGEPIAVSGIVVVPAGPPPAGGREIVAWAHPTTGVARHCAPSLYPQALTWIYGLEAMLARGYVVTATDYAGLGGPGVHPYLIGASAAHAVLDSVRAARAIPGAGAGQRFAVWGHSQGGHAALFTAEFARGYAPELQLAGIAAAAPATELAELFRADLRSPAGKVLGTFALSSWSRVFDLSLDGVIRPTIGLVVAHVAQICNITRHDLSRLAFGAQPFEREGFLATDITRTAPWSRLIRENTPGALPRGVPVFLVQGSADPVVRPQVTAQYMRLLCRSGTPVRFVSVPGDHAASAKQGAAAAVAWIADRFARAPVPDDCGRSGT